MVPYKSNSTRTESITNATDRLVGRLSPVNRDAVALHIQRRRNKGNKAPTCLNVAQALLHLDRWLKGRPLASLDARKATDFVSDLLNSVSQRSAAAYTIYIKAALREARGLEKLPADLHAALTVREPRTKANALILTSQDFEGLLGAARRMDGELSTLPRSTMTQAILWFLWDSGVRVREALGLNVGDVRFEDHDGAVVTMRRDQPDLKTGPRSLYISESVGALRTWLGLHPNGTDPKAPLFPAFRDRSGKRYVSYLTVHRIIKRLGEESGLHERQSGTKTLSPHDFRHTRATRAARAGWGEEQMRKFFGWSPGSKMPSTYIHLTLDDVREQVRRDAGVDAEGYRQAVETGSEEAQLAALLSRIMEKQNSGTHTRTVPTAPV